MATIYIYVFLIFRLANTFEYSDFKPSPPIKYMTDFLDNLDLSEYISPFSQLKALILIDNYKSANIKGLQYPTILRKYIKANWKVARKFEKTIWINPTALSVNGTQFSSANRNIIKCPLSKHLSEPRNPWKRSQKDFCVSLGLKFSFHSKTWNFQVHISLFLPINDS